MVNPGLVTGRCLERWLNGPQYAAMKATTAPMAYCAFRYVPGYKIVLPTTMSEVQRERTITRMMGVIRAGHAEQPAFYR